MSAPEAFGWGVIGAGMMAARFAADLRHAGDGRLRAVTSRGGESARRLAARHGARAHARLEDLLADPAVEAVYVASPNALHRAHCLAAIAAGKAVLCEKPFALNGAEAREVAAAARAAGVFCMEGMWMRFLPLMRELEARARGGGLGPLRLLRAELGHALPEGRRGGAMADLGVYGLSLAVRLLGPAPVRVHAAARRGADGADLQTAALLDYGAAQAVICASHQAELTGTLELVGERGRIEVEAPFLQALRLREIPHAPWRPDAPDPAEGRVKTLLKRSGLWPTARAAGRRLLGRSGRVRAAAYPGGGCQFEAAEVAARVRAGETESPLMPLSESVAVADLLDAVAGGGERLEARMTGS